jgi:hypothetical protein
MMQYRISRAAWVVAHAFLLLACTNEKEEALPRENGSVVFDTRAIVDDIDVYLFDGEGAHDGEFNRKIQNIVRSTGKLSMSIPVGKWNLALVGGNGVSPGQFIAPVRGTRASRSKMWETLPVNGVLPSVPEIRLAVIDGQVITHNASHRATAEMKRNVAKVAIVVQDARGFNEQGKHVIRLHDVPTSLAWSGELYPDEQNPEVSKVPMSGEVTIFKNPADAGRQLSDTLTFIVPAHAGVDAKDSTTHRMKLSVDLELLTGDRYRRDDIVIPRVPVANGVLFIGLKAKNVIEVTAEVLDWQDQLLDADLSNVTLYTSAPALVLASTDTLFARTNAPSITVTPGVSWITCTVLPATGGQVPVVVTADVASYDPRAGQRQGSITVKAGNVVKNIPVTQRPAFGSLLASKRDVYLSPVTNPDRSRDVVEISSTAPAPFNTWQIAPLPSLVTLSPATGPGTRSVTFTRKMPASATDRSVYGDERVVVSSPGTLDTLSINVHSLYLDLAEDLYSIDNPLKNADTTVVFKGALAAYGGARAVNAVTKPSWVKGVSTSTAGDLAITVVRDPDEERRAGTVTVAHASDPDYRASFVVVQEMVVRIPKFNYFVIRFDWSKCIPEDPNRKLDIDVAVRFFGNTGASGQVMPYDNKPVGFAMGNLSVTYNGQELLAWGGDQNQAGGESVLFNAPVLDNDLESPRIIKMEVYAIWYDGGVQTISKTPVNLDIVAYEGGTMTNDNHVYKNTGGKTVYQHTHAARVSKKGGVGLDYPARYTKVCEIEYDKLKHSARVTMVAPAQ